MLMGSLFFLSLQISLLLSIFFLPPFLACHAVIPQQSFVQCLKSSSFPGDLIFTRTSKNYTAILFSSVQNPRALMNSPKPLLIITPTQESHVQSSVFCSKRLNVPLRIRSGGHDYEGLSYASTTDPSFIVIDLQRLSSVIIDASVSTAWVQAGAILGELYYAIAMKSRVAAFPAGTCPTVGVGGHFGGGGLGTIMRAHGLAIDNVVDARIVNANGDVLDRESMGEDLFWALRGGGGGSFGVVLSYKIKLVQVPDKVTVFELTKKLSNEGSIKLLSKCQQIAHNLDKRVNLEAILQVVKEPNTNKTMQLTLNSLFLGEKEELVSLMKKSFPELELKTTDCTEMSWIESVMRFAKYSSSPPLTALLDRSPLSNNTSFKSKSDILTAPINQEGWREIFQWILDEKQWPGIIISPLGGRAGEISETETPFPHRKGSLYVIQYFTYWREEGNEEAKMHLEWMRRFSGFMAPYVSRNPRGAYLNHRDLDLGVNEEGNVTYAKASSWGLKYFKGNFWRLAKVKSEADPTNLFRNEQSIPLLY